MTKRLFSLGAAVALFMGFITGCQDSVVDSSTQSADPFAAYVVDEASMTDFSEIPSIESVLFSSGDDPRDTSDRGHHGGRDTTDRGGRDTTERDGRDTVGRGGHGGRDTAIRVDRGGRRDHGRGWGRLEHRSYGRILGRLNLTNDQKAAIEICFTDFRSCAESAAATYRAARQEKHEALQAAIEAIRAEVAAGTKTADEARTEIRALIETYRSEVAALNDTFKASLQSCKDALDACIEGHLTAEQLVIWERLHG